MLRSSLGRKPGRRAGARVPKVVLGRGIASITVGEQRGKAALLTGC
jgi:hypothetical protein